MTTPRLPGWVPPTTAPTPATAPSYVPPRRSLSRPSATRINSTAPREVTLTVSGQNEIIPVTYGEDRISGLWIVRPYTHIGTGELRFAMLWGWGPAEGVQDVYINGADVPAGVTMTHYTGEPGQGIDPILGADIPGFGDVFEGCAYTVFQVPPGTITGFPQTAQIEAVFRGRKVLDPRTNTVAWSRNPALALLDFCTDTRYGPGMPVRGIEAVADRCDSLVGGVEVRSQIGLTLTTGQYLDAWLDVLSTYAECLWSYDGDGILTVPDAPGEVVAVISQDDVVGNSWRFQGTNLASAPTVVTVNWRRSTETAEQWTDEPAIQELPGVGTGEVAEIRSDLSLPGIRRAGEANRKALTRLRRLQFPASYAWQMYDRGIVFQRGDIVQLPDTRGLNSWLVRVLSIEMVALGIYQITAEHYSESIYPDDVIPGNEAMVPVGGLLPFSGTVVPDGYEIFTGANGRYIIGAGGNYANGETGGSNIIASWSGSVSGGGHFGNRNMLVWGARGASPGADIPGSQFTPPHSGNHTHNYTVADSAPLNPSGRKSVWIKKTGTPGLVPEGGEVLSNGELISSTLSAVSSYLGRLMLADSVNANFGSNSASAVASIASANDSHLHAGQMYERVMSGPISGPYENTYDYVAGGGSHNHSGAATGTYTPNVRRRRMAVYMATKDSPIRPGCVIGFDPSETLPPGWAVCDGTNGTVDLRGFFIERSSVRDAGSTAGNNTAQFLATTLSDGAHGHWGTDRGYYKPYTEWWHGGSVSHNHTISGSRPFVPPYYAMTFIQYTGVE